MLTAFFALSVIYWGFAVISDALDIHDLINDYFDCTDEEVKSDYRYAILRYFTHSGVAMWALGVSIAYLIGWI